MPEFAQPETPELERLSEAHANGYREMLDFLEWIRNDEKIALMLYGKEAYDAPCDRRAQADAGYNAGFTTQDRQELCKDGKRPDGSECPRCKGTGYETHHREGWWRTNLTTEQFLYRYFNLDAKKIEAERQALIAMVQAQAAANGD